MIKLTKEMQDTKEKVNELCDKMKRVQKAYDYFYDNNRDEWCCKIEIIGQECIKKAAELSRFCSTWEGLAFNTIAVNKLIKFADDTPYNDYYDTNHYKRTLLWWKGVLLNNYVSAQYLGYKQPTDFDEVELEELELENA